MGDPLKALERSRPASFRMDPERWPVARLCKRDLRPATLRTLRDLQKRSGMDE